MFVWWTGTNYESSTNYFTFSLKLQLLSFDKITTCIDDTQSTNLYLILFVECQPKTPTQILQYCFLKKKVNYFSFSVSPTQPSCNSTTSANWKIIQSQIQNQVKQTTAAKSALFDLKENRKVIKTTFQGKVYNFLERPTGWKCFLYHFSV